MADDKRPQGETTNWPELAIGLYDKLTGRGAEITYDFEDFQVDVPSGTSDEQQAARWRLNGVIRVRTTDEESRARETKK